METREDRSNRILALLKEKYPDVAVWDVDGSGQHFVAEIEPTKDHPEYDRAIEVIFRSRPHKHLKLTQRYTVLSGVLQLHLDQDVVTLHEGDTYTISPGVIHWSESEDGAWVEEYSTPGWTREDHISAE